MQRVMMKSKIHRATVTGAELNYAGSITVDKRLMEAANLLPFEQVQVVDINNGARFETYVIEGESGSGAICLNGAAARLVYPGDKIIIISYGMFTEDEISPPVIVHVDENNAPIETPGVVKPARSNGTSKSVLAFPTPN